MPASFANAVVHVVTDVSTGVRSSHLHTRPRRRVGCHRSRSHQQGCQNIRTRKSHRGRCRCRRRRTYQRSRPSHHNVVHVGIRSAVTTTHAQGVELVAIAVAVAGRDVRTSALVNLHRPLQMPQASSAYAVVHVVKMPSMSASAAQSPPHTPKASLVPSQSQSPAGMLSPPQTPHRRCTGKSHRPCWHPCRSCRPFRPCSRHLVLT